MNIFRLASLAFVALWLAGCAPRGDLLADDDMQPSEQQRLRTLPQWDRLANESAIPGGTPAAEVQVIERRRLRALQQWDRLANEVAARASEAVRRQEGPPMPVYVSGTRATPFDDSFVELLRTRLVDHNVPVATSLIAGGLELRFDAQVISQQNEVLISTALQNNDLYLSRTSNSYRITRAEQSLYYRAPPPVPTVVKTWQTVQW
ncbi:hypothetical protein FXN63_23235 [Pigmentiphaga aceris]|uniref:DotD/TraH family lipoprotein n=1 Tax=Pigmentiphaga aceris TaxID=1940612 RepID=A0A5C0B2B1_9BURK|nr:hypothetical protein [Pigmentiphaga aceris]QEI08425.1 hypothetical protein FXN63_23235 [Pigmentiphaga aceris]